MLRRVNFEDVWDHIEPVARELLTDPRQNSTDDLWQKCVEGNATCFDTGDSIIIMSVRVNPNTHSRELHLDWGNRVSQDMDCFSRALPDLNVMAFKLGCSHITFDSTRPGWIKLAQSLGFSVGNIEFVKRVMP